MAKFYWIGLKLTTEQGPVYEIRGAYNTQLGRDAELVKQSSFWNSVGAEARPFETEGKKKDDALALAKQVLDASDEEVTPVTQPVPETPRETTTGTMTPVIDSVPSLEDAASSLAKETLGGDDLLGSTKSLEEIALEESSKVLGQEVVGGAEESGISEGTSLLEAASAMRESSFDLEAQKADAAFEMDTRDARQELFGEDEEQKQDVPQNQLVSTSR